MRSKAPATSTGHGVTHEEHPSPHDSGSSDCGGAVVLNCRPPLLPVSMDISGVDLSAIRVPAMSAGPSCFLLNVSCW